MPYFDHDGVRIFYTDERKEGTGATALLLHGWSCDSHDWSFQIPCLLQHGFRVIALDHRGHGRSSAPISQTPAKTYGPRAMAEDAVALLQHLQTGPVLLIGHSMGSNVASIMAVEHAELVKALVVMQPIYSASPSAMHALASKMRETPDRIPDIAVEFFDKVMYTPRTPEWIKTQTRRRVLGNAPEGVVSCLEGIVAVSDEFMGRGDRAKAFMQRRKGPRLAICGIPTAPAWEEELGLEAGGDEAHFVDGGTFVMLVEPEKVNRLLVDWLKKIDLLHPRQTEEPSRL